MTRGLMAACAFFGLVLLAEAGMAFYSDYAELRVETDARQFVNTAVERIATNWNQAVFREYAAADAIGFTGSQVERMRTLGKLTYSYPARGNADLAVSFPAFPWTAATGFYTADIACEHGTARIAVGVALLDGAWKIKVISLLKAHDQPK